MMEDSNNDADIHWGAIKESTDEARILYSSFFSEGQEFALNDNVEVYDAIQSEPHIGKIMKLWEERGSGKRKVLIQWFLRPKDLPQLDVEENSKELFLAFGKGKGVTNENDLEVVSGKCTVLCTSKDPRNRQPSVNDLKNADYFFSKIYNVDRGHISPIQGVVDKLGRDVVFNKQEWLVEGIKTEVNMAELPKANQENGKESSVSEGSSAQLSNPVDVSTKVEEQSACNSLPESKKRPRNTELTIEAQKKKLVHETQKQSAAGSLKRSSGTTDEVGRNKKPKVLESPGPTALKEVRGKVGGNPVVSPDGSTKIVKPKKDLPGKDQSPKPEISLVVTDTVQSKMQTLKTEVLSLDSSINVGKSKEEAHGKDQPRKAEKVSQPVEDKVKASKVEEEIQGSKVEKTSPSREGLTKPVGSSVVSSGIKNTAKSKSGKGEDDSLSMRADKKGTLSKDIKINAIKKLKNEAGTEGEQSSVAKSEPTKTDIGLEKRRIFKELSWEENLEQGISYGKVILLHNFDPWATSADVRDMMKSVFEGFSDARVIPQETIIPYGQALVIFETKSFADAALQEIERKCLVTNSKRPLIASKVKPFDPSKMSRFPGHLALEKLRLSRALQSEDMRRAVATSHCSQPNTIEYEMAMEWRHLQEIAHTCRVELFKKQRKDIDDIRKSGIKKT